MAWCCDMEPRRIESYDFLTAKLQRHEELICWEIEEQQAAWPMMPTRQSSIHVAFLSLT